MAIETEVGVLKSVVSKLDTSLEKISQVSNDIGRLLAVHDERIMQLEKEGERKTDDIRDLHSRLTTQTREIVSKIDSMEIGIEKKMRENSAESAKQHKEILDEIKKDVENISTRVNVLEQWRWYIIGGSITVGFILGNLSDLVKFIK
jgi:hypothetical protein